MPSMSRSPSPQRSRHRRRRSSSSGRSRSRSPRRSRRDRRDSRSPPPPTRRQRDDRERREEREEPRERRPRPEAERDVKPRREELDREMDEQRRGPPPKAKLFDPFSGEEKPQSSRDGGGVGKDEKISKPSFEPSGKLAADTNTFKGVVIKYNEPPEAAKPKLRWRLYPMKGEEVMQPIYIHRQSAYLVGRDRKIADFPVDHPSCSKQHAVLQYRSMPFEKNGVPGRRILPYIIDLGSANGTYLNGQRIDAQRYYELKEQDLLKFGFSSREYAVLHELSAEGRGGEALDEELEGDDEIDLEGAEEKLLKQEEDYF